jgi:hypothetical protein
MEGGMNHFQATKVFTLAALAGMSFFSSASAQPPEQKNAARVVDWHSKRFAFATRAKPWTSVFEWVSDQTQMTFISQHSPPAGTFTFINPKDANGNSRQYSLAEVCAIIDEILQSQHRFMLLRNESAITISPSEEPIPAGWHAIAPSVAPPALQSLPAAACCESTLRCREGLLARIFRR